MQQCWSITAYTIKRHVPEQRLINRSEEGQKLQEKKNVTDTQRPPGSMAATSAMQLSRCALFASTTCHRISTVPVARDHRYLLVNNGVGADGEASVLDVSPVDDLESIC